jgi:peroxiredoxin
VQILGISANNPFSQKTFANSLELPFPLLSDFPELKTIRSYGGLSQDYDLTLAQRWFFLVDRQGIVRGAWRGTSRDVFPSAPILQAVRDIEAKQ